MFVHHFTDNALLASAFSRIFKCLKWKSSHHASYEIGQCKIDPKEDSMALFSLGLSKEVVNQIKELSARCPELPIVLFADVNDNPETAQILHLVRAIVPPDICEAQIKWIFHLAAEGYIILPAEYHPVLAETQVAMLPPDTTAALLTNRENEILQQIAEGSPNKEIARLLDISLNTVQAHVSSIFRKLDVANRTQAAKALKRSKIGLPIRIRHHAQEISDAGMLK